MYWTFGESVVDHTIQLLNDSAVVGLSVTTVRDQEVVGSIPSWVSIRWLLLGWVTVCRQLNNLGILPTTKVNSAFHPSWVGKLSTGQSGVARSPVSGGR